MKNLDNFNPRTHEECDDTSMIALLKAMKISIHALTRSATHLVIKPQLPIQISIHALTRSAT